MPFSTDEGQSAAGDPSLGLSQKSRAFGDRGPKGDGKRINPGAICDAYVGRTLIVEPYYGYGWYHPPGGPLGDHEVPTPFHLRVERVYSYKDERRGVLARVTEPAFVYDGFWLVSMTRHVGVWNFTDRPAAYNLLLCPAEPVEGKEEDSPEYGKLWPVWHLRGQPQASGFGRIAESLQCCADYDARRDAEAEQGAAPDRGRHVGF